MKLLRALCLMAVFCLDVHVRADSLEKHDEKESCWGVSLPCSIYASQGKKVLESEGLRMVLAPGALVEQRTGNLVQLVSGSVYIEISRPLRIGTPYGKFWCPDECTALINRQSGNVKLKSLAGAWIVERLGEKSDYELKPATQVWLSEVSDTGQASMEFPQSLPWDSTVKNWAALFPGEPEEFKQALVKFRKVWKEAVEEVSEVHNRAADRNIASHNQELAEEAKRRQKVEKEQQDLKELFRLKTLGQ